MKATARPQQAMNDGKARTRKKKMSQTYLGVFKQVLGRRLVKA